MAPRYSYDDDGGVVEDAPEPRGSDDGVENISFIVERRKKDSDTSTTSTSAQDEVGASCLHTSIAVGIAMLVVLFVFWVIVAVDEETDVPLLLESNTFGLVQNEVQAIFGTDASVIEDESTEYTSARGRQMVLRYGQGSRFPIGD